MGESFVTIFVSDGTDERYSVADREKRGELEVDRTHDA